MPKLSKERLAEIKAAVANDGAIKSKVDGAFQMVFKLCKEGPRAWRMSIPVREESDSDTVICAGLREADKLRGEVADLVADLEEARAAIYKAMRNTTHSYHIEGTWREVEVHDDPCARCILEKALAATESSNG